MSEPEDLGIDVPQWRLSRASTTLGQQLTGNGGALRQRFADVANKAINQKRDTYAYKNIDYDKEIRVLRLYPGAHGSTISCCLVDRPLLDQVAWEISNAPGSIKYTALSYYWGDEDPEHNINIFTTHNHYKEWKIKPDITRDSVGCMYIRKNLKEALEQLRSENVDVYLWADALCINQKNLTERTAQVARMHNVFMHAEKVCIWLGAGDPAENQKTFDFLEKILDLENLEEVAKRLVKRKDDGIWEEDRQDCKRFIDLMKVEWFSRRWVIQELLLATNAHVRRGNREMPWLEFADAIALFMTKYDDIRSAFRSPESYSASRTSDNRHFSSLDARALGANTLVTATSRLFRKSSEGRILHRLLSLEVLVSSMLLPFEARDPKDTVFAVLQIAKNIPSSDQMAGYSKTWIEVFKLYLAPAFLIILWSSDTYTLLPYAAIKDVPSENMDSRVKSYLVILIWYCIAALNMVLVWLTYRMLSDMINAWTSHFQTPKTLDKRIKPDYRKCFRDVCADFIEYCIEDSNSLDILCRHWAPQAKSLADTGNVSMPSWILPITGHAFCGPEQSWKRRSNGDSFVGGFEIRTQYTASGSLRPSYVFGKTNAVQRDRSEEIKQKHGEYTTTSQDKSELPPRFDGILKVKGFQLGTIKQTAHMAGGIITPTALELCGWSKSDPGNRNLDQVWRILVANRGPGGINPPTWYRRVCEACLQWYAFESGEDVFNTNGLKDLDGTPAAKIAFLERVQQVTYNRKIIRTSTQTYIGVAPPESERSDIVCILYGCSVPVVLRPFRNGYKFLGGCYIHGVMDGEAVESAPKGQDFKLM